MMPSERLRSVLQEGEQSQLVARAIELLNAMAQSKDDQIVNLLEVSVFEIVADDGECLARVEPHLSEVARAHLDRVLQGGLQQ